MRWFNASLGIAVVALLALNLRAQLATQRKLDALAAPPPPAAAVPPEAPMAAAPDRAKWAMGECVVVEPPDILTIESATPHPLSGQFLVRPDGTVSLGEYGSVAVSGRTLPDVKRAISAQLSKYMTVPPAVNVDVQAYNGKRFYIIRSHADGDAVCRFPLNGNPTVVDVLRGTVPSEGRVHVARRTETGAHEILPVDWVGITRHGVVATNYQLVPGDRIHVARR